MFVLSAWFFGFRSSLCSCDMQFLLCCVNSLIQMSFVVLIVLYQLYSTPHGTCVGHCDACVAVGLEVSPGKFKCPLWF